MREREIVRAATLIHKDLPLGTKWFWDTHRLVLTKDEDGNTFWLEDGNTFWQDEPDDAP